MQYYACHSILLYGCVFQYWLDVEKQLNHQVGLSSQEPLLKFCVKFYTPDPSLIEEEYTRYLFGLEIKRDLAMGQLQCNDNTAALMASYIVQGKTISTDLTVDATRLKTIHGSPKRPKYEKNCPSQTPNFLKRV